MSIISISFDTVKKVCKVSMDGKNVPNVKNIYIETYEYDKNKEESHIEVSTREKLEDDGLSKRTTLYASQQKENAISIDELSTYANKSIEATVGAVMNWLKKE